MTRDELIARLYRSKRELQHSGYIHRKDLRRYIYHMEKTLRYDKRYKERDHRV